MNVANVDAVTWCYIAVRQKISRSVVSTRFIYPSRDYIKVLDCSII